MKLLIVLLCVFMLIELDAQEKIGVVYPGGAFTNRTEDTVFYLSKGKLEGIMQREENCKELIKSLTERNVLCDSLVALKTVEVEVWYGRLIESDVLLEEERVLRVEERTRARRRAGIWFWVGVLVGGVLVGL